jgi:hypothetical protein
MKKDRGFKVHHCVDKPYIESFTRQIKFFVYYRVFNKDFIEYSGIAVLRKAPVREGKTKMSNITCYEQNGGEECYVDSLLDEDLYIVPNPLVYPVNRKVKRRRRVRPVTFISQYPVSGRIGRRTRG